MSGKRYPGGGEALGKTLTEFGNSLAGLDYENINSEWQSILLGTNFIGVSLEDSEYLKRQVETIEKGVVFVFDFAITAVSLYRDFIFFLPNFMNAVVNYIAGLLYNALDSFLRLGVYALVVPPNLTDTAYKGLPTTSLREQTDNAYRKFYDYADPNLPYYLPPEKDLPEEILDSGQKIKNKLKYYFEDSTLAGTLNPSGEKRNYMNRDFIDLEKSLENLARPLGIYDAIYLYFSIDYQNSTATIQNFLEAVAMVADLFKFPTIEGLMEEYDSLFRPKRKNIKVLCADKIAGVSESAISNAGSRVRKVDMKTKKRVYIDPNLSKFRIFESTPSSSITDARRDKIIDLFQEQISYDTTLQEAVLDESIESITQFRLKNNAEYQLVLDDIAALEDEIQYYDFKDYVTNNFLSGVTPPPFVSADIITYNSALLAGGGLLNSFTNPNNSSEYANALEFMDNRNDFLIALRRRDAIAGEGGDVADAEEVLFAVMDRLYTSAQDIAAETIVTVNPAPTSQADRKSRLAAKLAQKAAIEKLVEDSSEEYIKEDVLSRTKKIIQEKQKQINYISGLTGDVNETISNLNKSAQITFLTKYYPNSGRASLYESYLEKFYNFNTRSDADYMYEFTIEVDATDGQFSNKIDSFHTGQFVQIREDIGGGNYAYRGSGVIVAEHEQVFDDAGYGTWVKANFSDIIGLTPDIKRLQNEIMGFQNLFEPNTTYLDVIIDWLKDVKKRIIELIDILKKLIDIIQLLLSVSFKGQVLGKYIREEDYDELSIGLTDTSKLNLTPSKKNFKPGNLSTVNYYLTKIAAIDSAEAIAIKNEVDSVFTQTSPADDKIRKNKIRDNSVINPAYPPAAAITASALALQTSLETEVKGRANNLKSLFDLGSSVLADLTEPSGVMTAAEAKQVEQEQKIAYYKAKIYAECAKYESNMTNEFGFSIILLSYLPKGLGFYPVRFIAQQLGLFEQNVSTDAVKIFVPPNSGVPPSQVLTELDSATIDALMPNKTKADLMNNLMNQSKNSNPARRIQPDPQPITVTLEPLLTTIDFVFDDPDVLAMQANTLFLNVAGTTINLPESLRKKYLGGAELKTNGLPLQLGTGTSAVNSNYKYLYEFEMDSGAAGLSCNPDDPELGKLQVHMGVFQTNSTGTKKQGNIPIKAFELNGDGNQIFRFGRRQRKQFRGEIYLKQDKKYIMPYILIGYDDDLKLDQFNFDLINSEIKFYRVA